LYKEGEMSSKTVLISGASGLIGKDIVKLMLEQGNSVIATDINPDILDTESRKIPEKLRKNLHIYELDITSEESINKVVDEYSSQGGVIDILINSAYPRNVNYGRKLPDVTFNDFCENISINVGGYFLTSQILCDHFLKNGKGNIVNVASIYGTLPPRFSIYEGTEMTMPVEYSAMKAAIIQLTKYFAQYYKKYNIRANSISPGGVINEQPQIFKERYKEHTGNIGLLSPSQVSATINFLCSDLSDPITGQNLIVDDGFSL